MLDHDTISISTPYHNPPTHLQHPQPTHLPKPTNTHHTTSAALHTRGFRSSRLYVSQKWGCDAEQAQCAYSHPFNDPRLPLSYWRLDWARCVPKCVLAGCLLSLFFFFRLYIFLDLKNDRLVVARWIQSPLSISPPPSCCGYLVVSVMLQRTEDTYLPACLILPPSLPPSLPSTPRRRRQRTDPPNPLFLPPTHDDRRQCILRTERRPRGCRYTLDQPLGPLPHPPLDDQARPRKGLLRGVFDWPG